MAWLTGWTYRKSHVIGSANNAGTNYQVKIIAHYGTGTDNAGDVYLNNHARNDFGDVRFTSSDQTTLLDYWMESKTDNNNAVFWVEVSDNLSAANVTIYIYYGNATATTTSNGVNTFAFFDDFPGTSIDTTKWGGDTGSATVSNSIMTLTGGAVWKKLWGLVEKLPPYAMRTKAQTVGYAPNYGGEIALRDPSTADLCDIVYFGGTTGQIRSFKAGTGTVVNSNDDANMNTYEICWTTSSVKFFMNNAAMTGSPITTNIPTVDLPVQFQSVGGAGYEVKSDWALLRKYVDPEPAHGAWGSEETAQQVTRSVTELLGGYDVKSRIANLYRIKVDYVGLLDSKYKKLSKIFSDYIGLLDIKSTIHGFYRIVTEYMGLLETKYKKLSKVFIDYVGLLDVKSRISTLHRTFIEQLGLMDTKIKRLSRIITEKIGLLDVKSILRNLHRTFIEYVGIMESRIIKKSLHKIIVEYLGIKDIYYRFYYKWRRFQHPKQHVEVES